MAPHGQISNNRWYYRYFFLDCWSTLRQLQNWCTEILKLEIWTSLRLPQLAKYFDCYVIYKTATWLGHIKNSDPIRSYEILLKTRAKSSILLFVCWPEIDLGLVLVKNRDSATHLFPWFLKNSYKSFDISENSSRIYHLFRKVP